MGVRRTLFRLNRKFLIDSGSQHHGLLLLNAVRASKCQQKNCAVCVMGIWAHQLRVSHIHWFNRQLYADFTQVLLGQQSELSTLSEDEHYCCLLSLIWPGLC